MERRTSGSRDALFDRSAKLGGGQRLKYHAGVASLEITDVIVDNDPETLQRRPVRKDEALSKLRDSGASAFALQCVRRLPDEGGVLDPDAVDEVMIAAHAEMQRLWETFLHGARVANVLGEILAAARDAGIRERLRVVDVGCGCGYVLRWLAARRVLSGDVELLGVDYNRALISKATALARAERLDVRFEVANAFRLSQPAHVFLSTGVIHHFAAEQLPGFFRAQAERAPLAFVHFDARRSWAAPIGAWLFHKAKFRGRIGQHDGYLSAVRAHDTDVLLDAARSGAKDMLVAEYNKRIPFLPFLRAMHAVVGVREQLSSVLERLP